MTAPRQDDERPDDAQRRGWQDQVEDLLKDADLPPAPLAGPTDAELRAAYEVEQRETLIGDALMRRMAFDFWCLRQFSVANSAETAKDEPAALRGLEAARNIKAFAREELEDLRESADDADDEDEARAQRELMAEYQTVIDNVAALEARIRSLNPAAAAKFDEAMR